MKIFCLLLGFVVIGSLPARGQDQKSQGNPPPRPTLGRPTEPSGEVSRTSTTTDARKLARIRTLYVERIDNQLSDKLAESLSKSGRFRIVADSKQADAVIRGTCFDSHRLKSLHTEIFTSDRRTGASIWQDVVRRPFNPPPIGKVVNETAAIIIQHLTASIEESERK